ncbi:MAG: multidrug efflux RND transporter permease subunit [Acidobacteria bacterium]|nr:multidrug efflux RND transporter permease subunit [Acidobacteriota bacterium]
MFSAHFIRRPRLAMVVSLIILMAGGIAAFNLPILQYPDVTPPTVQVSASYPGANSQVVSDAVAAPIEEAVNGVEGMIYMSSSSTDGGYSLSVTFDVGVDIDIAQVKVQNRVQRANSRLPAEVRQQAVNVSSRSGDILGMLAFYSPKGTHDQLAIGTYLDDKVKDVISRVEGISEVGIMGPDKFSMRIWLNPDKLAAYGISADAVSAAVASQNIQAAAGSIGTEPAYDAQQLQFSIRATGRMQNVEEFENIVIRTNGEGGLLTLKDVARIELGAERYMAGASFNGQPAIAFRLTQLPEANALETLDRVQQELERLSGYFPEDLEYQAVFDPTLFIRTALSEILFTLLLTFGLVVLVVFIFLQDWRATLIPACAIPVSLIGTFSVLLALGYSINTLTLFALVLAIGIVVDDAIVVVENVQRLIETEHLSPGEATQKAMRQVSSAVVATTLVLLAIFIPIGFISGITGKIYQQFAVTISTAVSISTLNALTLSPALCSILLRPHRKKKLSFFGWFNWGLDRFRNLYVASSTWLVRHKPVAVGIFLVVSAAAWFLFSGHPTSFLPDEDQGVVFVDVQLPENATQVRTREVMREFYEKAHTIPGIEKMMTVVGFSMLGGGGDNSGMAFVRLQLWDERKTPELQLDAIMARLNAVAATIPGARIRPFNQPPIRGLGATSGMDFRLQAGMGQSSDELAAALDLVVAEANRDPRIGSAFSTYRASTPQLYIDVDREKAETLEVPISRVFSTLQTIMGSRYINDFNLHSRVYQVKVQGDFAHRSRMEDILNVYVQNNRGGMVPLTTLVRVTTILAPQSIDRYNMYPAVRVNADVAPGYSSSQGMDGMESAMRNAAPSGFQYEWTGMSYQERENEGQVILLVVMALVFGFLFLVGQYESWTIPVPVMLSIAVAALGAMIALRITDIPLSIYAQLGLVLLVGLASKNAILIVEFAKTEREHGHSILESATKAARIRYRAVLMTAFSFILGVLPMVLATGAGAVGRRHIGTTVFGGMVAAAAFGVILTPSLWAIFQEARERFKGYLHMKNEPGFDGDPATLPEETDTP